MAILITSRYEAPALTWDCANHTGDDKERIDCGGEEL